jgi:hypothetical protein
MTKQKEEITPHIHNWVDGFMIQEKKCGCGKILVSQAEYDRRVEETNAYYKFVLNSDAYRDNQAMRKAYKEHNMPEIKKIMVRVEERLKNGEYTEKLHFPDPESGVYIIA